MTDDRSIADAVRNYWRISSATEIALQQFDDIARAEMMSGACTFSDEARRLRRVLDDAKKAEIDAWKAIEALRPVTGHDMLAGAMTHSANKAANPMS